MRKFGSVAALLVVLLTGCGDPVATAPAAPVELVAYDKAGAIEACRTLAQDQVLDCMNAVANTDW